MARRTRDGQAVVRDRQVPAHVGAVLGAQLTEDERRDDREQAKHHERLVDARHHLQGGGPETIGHEHRGGQRGHRDAEAHRHLLDGAGDAAAHARVALVEVGVNQSVHARVLQRGDIAERHGLQRDYPDRCRVADYGEEPDDQSHEKGVDAQHAPVAEPGEDRRYGELQADGGQELRHDQQPRLHRRIPEADLVQQRQEERHPAGAEAGHEASDHRDPKGPRAKQAQSQHRMGGLRRMVPVRHQQGHRQRQQPRHLEHAERVLAEDLQDVGQQRDTGPEQGHAGDVERIDRVSPIVGQISQHEI